MNKTKEQIICGFAGIGKSYLAKNKIGVVDLESTPFNKDWDLYSNVAIHMAKNGYIVLLSCHKEIRNILKKKEVDFKVAIPRKNLKEEYLLRYKNRGNTPEFIKTFDDKWEEFIKEIESERNHILYVDDYLSI